MNIDSMHQVPLAMDAADTPRPVEPQSRNPQIVSAVKAVNEAALLGQKSELTFRFERGTQRPVIQLVDRETRKVIEQIPAEYVLRVARQLSAQSQEDTSDAQILVISDDMLY